MPDTVVTKNPPRIIAFIPVEGYVKDHGFRVAFVTEGEPGYSPSGTWPYDGSAGQTLPWFWGDSFEEATKLAEVYNEKNGISKGEAAMIILRSMAITKPTRGQKRRK